MHRRASTTQGNFRVTCRGVVAALLVGFVAQLLVTSMASGATRPPVQVTTDIAFHQLDASTYLRLDVWRRPGALRPVVVMFHGGGWRAGSRAEWSRIGWAQAFAAAGFVVVTPSYRLACVSREDEDTAVTQARDAPCGGTMAQQRDDVERAVRWTFEHARQFGGDPDRVVLLGGSAGAHLALLAAADPGIARRRAGAAAISAPVDLRSIGRLGLHLNGAVELAIRCSWVQCPSRWAVHSPRVALEQAVRVVPTYLYASRRDVRSSRTDTFRMAAALRKRGAPVALREPMSTTSACHGPRACERFPVAGTRLRLRVDVMRWAVTVTAPRPSMVPGLP